MRNRFHALVTFFRYSVCYALILFQSHFALSCVYVQSCVIQWLINLTSIVWLGIGHVIRCIVLCVIASCSESILTSNLGFIINCTSVLVFYYEFNLWPVINYRLVFCMKQTSLKAYLFLAYVCMASPEVRNYIRSNMASPFWYLLLLPESGFFGFSNKCEMCLRVVGGNNYIFYVICKYRSTVILSQIFAIFLHFCEILNIHDKNKLFIF